MICFVLTQSFSFLWTLFYVIIFLTSYHFSARLVPWVHYVPLSFSASDLTEKVEWLQRNDDMAQQLALNARNFGKSYLRMEDHICYLGAALTVVAALERHTDATTPFKYPQTSV